MSTIVELDRDPEIRTRVLPQRMRLPIPAIIWQHPAMPKLSQPIIEVAWRHAGEAGKIHYRAKRPDGTNRHG